MKQAYLECLKKMSPEDQETVSALVVEYEKKIARLEAERCVETGILCEGYVPTDPEWGIPEEYMSKQDEHLKDAKGSFELHPRCYVCLSFKAEEDTGACWCYEHNRETSSEGYCSDHSDCNKINRKEGQVIMKQVSREEVIRIAKNIAEKAEADRLAAYMEESRRETAEHVDESKEIEAIIKTVAKLHYDAMELKSKIKSRQNFDEEEHSIAYIKINERAYVYYEILNVIKTTISTPKLVDKIVLEIDTKENNKTKDL